MSEYLDKPCRSVEKAEEDKVKADEAVAQGASEIELKNIIGRVGNYSKQISKIAISASAPTSSEPFSTRIISAGL